MTVLQDGLRPSDDGSALPVELGSLGALRAAVARRARGCGLPEHGVDDMVLVANELATNVIRHGGGHGRMRLWCAPGAMYCEVSDEGPGMDEPDRAGLHRADPYALTGRGLWLIRRICQSLRIVSGPQGTTVTVGVALLSQPG